MSLQDFLDSLVSRIEVLENQYLQVSDRCDRLETRVKSLQSRSRLRRPTPKHPHRMLDTDTDPLAC